VSTQLVNWKPNEKKFIWSGNPNHLTKTDFLKQLRAKSRPKEIEDLVAALTSMWQRIGAATNCGKCFQGKLARPIYVHGCCGSCPSLGEFGCIAKPIACALYTCREAHFEGFEPAKASYFRGVFNTLNDLAYRVGLNKGYFSDGYLRECAHSWTEFELTMAKTITKMLNMVY
jgi:hypothetical protein